MTETQRVRRTRPDAEVATKSTRLVSNKKRADISRQMHQDDEFALTPTGSFTLVPPYSPSLIQRCLERSNMLRQCIEAYVTNIGLCGYEIVPRQEGVEMAPDEVALLRAFIDAANADESLPLVNAKIVHDEESHGYAFLEVIRNRKGAVSLVRHVPAGSMRLTPRDDAPVEVTYLLRRGNRDVEVTEFKTFRRFVQVVNGKTRYFKEFGDPRRLHMDTGRYADVTKATEATEIIHFRQYSDDPYGTPRWINQLPSILGSREAEECNLRYFEDNTVPPLALLVAGGRLTAGSYRELKALLDAKKLGKERQHQVVIIEAMPERDSLDDKGNVTISLEKLADARQSDGLFKDYDESNQTKIRSSFRLPPTAVGMSQDANFATARVSIFVAENQVYTPQRMIYDEIYNKKIVNHPDGLGLTTVKLKSLVPSITDAETLVKSLTALNVMGALTPRSANEAANKLLQIDLPSYPQPGEDGYEDWMDKPIVFVTKGTASDAGQNQKDAATKQVEGGGALVTAPKHGQE